MSSTLKPAAAMALASAPTSLERLEREVPVVAPVIVTNPQMSAEAHTIVGPHFDYDILSSAAIPDGEAIALVPHGLWTGYSGDDVRIEASKQVTMHFEDTTPLPLVDGAGVLASPQRSAFQQDLIALKLRARVAWAILPGAIASVTGANW
jgi:hypothetical protein